VSGERASFFQTVKAVAWSFFGVRRRTDYESDARQLNPVAVILTGIAGAILFVLVLVAIVKLVTSN